MASSKKKTSSKKPVAKANANAKAKKPAAKATAKKPAAKATAASAAKAAPKVKAKVKAKTKAKAKAKPALKPKAKAPARAKAPTKPKAARAPKVPTHGDAWGNAALKKDADEAAPPATMTEPSGTPALALHDHEGELVSPVEESEELAERIHGGEEAVKDGTADDDSGSPRLDDREDGEE